MKRLLSALPLFITLSASLLLLVHGPIPQLANYHDFADHRSHFGIPYAADVLSNAGFALLGLWGLLARPSQGAHGALRISLPGYRLFLASLFLTAIGSSFYHLAPDNARLVWDRLPIALACAGLLATVGGARLSAALARRRTLLLALYAVLSVAWWHFTQQHGEGDLRPYLLLQGLPLLLIPLWLIVQDASREDRRTFGLAIVLYVAAKLAELQDHALLEALGGISGHTLKHLLATAAAALVVWRFGGVRERGWGPASAQRNAEAVARSDQLGSVVNEHVS